ncbi:MAG: magnesium transporter [Desulfurococcales archaeon]|nr:magnesium transporter [Desulfurococcales archaeon]
MKAQENMEDLLDEIKEELEKGVKKLKILEALRPQDFIDILERLDSEDRRKLAVMIPDSVYVEIIAKLPQQVLNDVLKVLGIRRLARIAIELPVDELADLLEALPPSLRISLLRELPAWKIAEVRPLLKYPPETAGGIMTTRIPVFYEERLVGNAVEEFIARSEFEGYDTSRYIYVVDSKGRLRGVVDIKRFLTSPRNKKLKDIMMRNYIAVKADIDQEEVAKLVVKYDLDEVPVVDDEGVLLGAITADDIMDVLVNEATEDLVKFGGIVKIREPYLAARIRELVRKRIVWLIALYLGDLISVTIISRYESLLSAVIALSFFIPVLTDTGGNAGSQAATLVIRSLAMGEARLCFSDALRIIAKETITSLIMGALLSPIAFSIGYIMSGNALVALTLGLAIILVVYVGSIMGAMLPIVTARLGLDPAVISAPLITTVADATGLMMYFTIATLLLSYLHL